MRSLSGLLSGLRYLRRASLAGRIFFGLGVFLLVLAGFYAVHAIDVLRVQYLGGIAGTVTVQDCQWDDGTDGWACSGEFTSDDGAVRIPEVEIRPVFPDPPPAPVPALVSSASSETAHQPDPSGAWVRLLLLPILLGSAGYFLLLAVRDGREAESLPASVPDRPAEQILPGIPMNDEFVASVRASRRIRTWVLPWLVIGYAALLAAVAGLIWHTAAWNRDQDLLLSATVTARVVDTRLGSDDRIEVSWANDSRRQTARLTPIEPGEFHVGDPVKLRFDPGRPEVVYPVDREAFEWDPRGRNLWVGLLLVPGLPLAWAWTWRLGRWLSGLPRRAYPVVVDVLVAEPKLGSEPAAFWLRIREPDGTVRYQRTFWNRRLLGFAIGAPDTAAPSGSASPRHPPGEAAPVRPTAVARRCLGLRRMLIVDLPGVGRLWPASTARRRPPSNYDLEPVRPNRLGERHRAGASAVVKGMLGLMVLMGLAYAAAGPVAAGYLLVLAGSLWLWYGATPWLGLYAYPPGTTGRQGPTGTNLTGRAGLV